LQQLALDAAEHVEGVELLHGADQAEEAFLDRIEEGHAPADIALGQRPHAARVCF
jgi:hypothetical protein